MKTKISTQPELDAAIAQGITELDFIVRGEYEINRTGVWLDIWAAAELGWRAVRITTKSNIFLRARGSSQPHVVARESSQPHVEAWESSQPHVVAWGSSQPHVVARESSQPHVEARESSQPHVVARGSSQPHVVARESSQPHVVAWGSSQPHVVARESSQPHVVARESSQPHVEASGYVQLSIFGRVIASLTAKCQVMIRGTTAQVTGGQQTIVDLQTAQDWCDYYGVTVNDGIAIVYKGVRDCYGSFHDRDFKWMPGSAPKSEKWDQEECSHGLHFSPHPRMTLGHHSDAKRFLACPVKVEDMLIFFNGNYPHKCKAPAVVAPCWEVDINGKKIEAEKVAA